MTILVIDTAHREARVLLVQGGSVLAKREWENGKTVGIDLLMNIEEVLQEAGLELREMRRIAVHRGPGGYSSLRAGIVAGETLAFALGAELAAVSEEGLEALASQAQSAEAVQTIEAVYQ